MKERVSAFLVRARGSSRAIQEKVYFSRVKWHLSFLLSCLATRNITSECFLIKKIINDELKIQFHNAKDLQAHPLVGWRLLFFPCKVVPLQHWCSPVAQPRLLISWSV